MYADTSTLSYTVCGLVVTAEKDHARLGEIGIGSGILLLPQVLPVQRAEEAQYSLRSLKDGSQGTQTSRDICTP